MGLRLEYRTIAPGAVKALGGLNAYSDTCSISQNLRRMVEILVSQINGCTYCINVHTRQAVALGESEARIAALTDWRNSSSFTPLEEACFAWAESVTRIGHDEASDEAYENLGTVLSELEIVDLTFVIVAMNAWNRLAISMGREARTST